MESNELIKRYIYAVTKHLPENKRQDVGRELESLIEETLAERSQDGQAADSDTKLFFWSWVVRRNWPQSMILTPKTRSSVSRTSQSTCGS